MKLISSADTLAFLSQSAPKPWVKRMLQWMIYEGELNPYFIKGRIVPFSQVYAFTIGIGSLRSLPAGAERDAEIRKQFGPDVADQLVGKELNDRINDDPIEWDETDDPQQVGAGFFVYADELDWDLGAIKTTLISPDLRGEDHLFWDYEDHLATQFDKPDFEVVLTGLCFSLAIVEMLQPSGQLHFGEGLQTVARPNSAGRPRK